MPYDADAPKTPRDNMVALRNRIAALDPKDFNMSRWTTCIAAQAGKMLDIEVGPWGTNRDRIGEKLGLSESETRNLFLGYPFSTLRVVDGSMSSTVTQAQALRVIDHYLDAGKVDWKTMDLPYPETAPVRESELLYA